MNEKKRRKYTGLLSDVEKANTTVLKSFVICSLVYSVIGYFIFKDQIQTVAFWKVALYYILLLLPVGLGLLDYNDSRGTEEFRYTMYIPAMAFYCYLLLLDKGYTYFILAVCLIGMAVIYCDTHFSKIVGYLLFAMHMVSVIYLYF